MQKKGLKGNVNVASFMYEYANFGIYGLILSGAFLGLLFLSIEKIFVNNLTLKLYKPNTCFNFKFSSNYYSSI